MSVTNKFCVVGMSAASTPSEAHSAAVSPVNGPIKPPTNMLVMSGGEGYIDFRNGMQFNSYLIYFILISIA